VRLTLIVYSPHFYEPNDFNDLIDGDYIESEIKDKYDINSIKQVFESMQNGGKKHKRKRNVEKNRRKTRKTKKKKQKRNKRKTRKNKKVVKRK
jgi:hypothetical protein